MHDEFIDITITSDLPYAYGGVINKNINDLILKADKYNEVKFLLGKTENSLYNNYSNNITVPKLTNIKNSITLDFIHRNPNYTDLSKFINSSLHIKSIEDLTKILPNLEQLLQNCKNNREFTYYDNIIEQIKNLNR
jgi:hypothetical protein